jgi:hypothetical protein
LTQRRTRLAAVLAFAAASLALAVLERSYRPYAEDGLYFHAWTSEYMMQTLSVADLRAEPLRSLFYLHIQPPAFDAIRALLVAWHHDLRGAALLRAVDADLYSLWLLASGAVAALIALWIGSSEGVAAGWLASMLFALSPGAVFYATFLDSTLLSALLLLWFYYELGRLASGAGSRARFGASLVSLFLTRSAFQWPFLLVCATALRLVGLSWRRALQVLWAPALVTTLFLAKQYAVFGLGVTSSFGPDSWCKGLMEYCHGRAPVALPRLPDPRRASALRRTRKLGGYYNYNQLAFLRRSFSQVEEYKQLLRQRTLGQLVGVAVHNAGIYLRPTSSHSPHVIIERLPWRRPYEALLAGPWLLALLTAAGVFWLRSAGAGGRAVARGVGMALPALYVAAVSIVFESGENMRYRFFLEPVCFVFLALQGLGALRYVRGRAGGASAAPA